MADSTRISASNILCDQAAPGETINPAATATEVAPRPAWMRTTRESAPSKDEGNAPRRRSRVILTPDVDNADVDLPITDRIKQWLRTAAAAGYGMTLMLHVLLLVGMALWFFPQIKESMSITTVVQSDVEEIQTFDSLDDVQLEAPAGAEEILKPQLTEIVADADLNVLETQLLQDITSADTEGDGGSSGVGSGGFRLLEPKNAVKAGSFTAWTIPIAEVPGEKTRAGDSPRPGQDYHIVIQVRVPTDNKTYVVNDLSGRVIGTDGYVQIIPAQAFFQNDEGRFIPAKLGRRVPIVDGVVQIIIRVPGAEALVKDTINIKSKRLKESQKLELVFGKGNRQF